MKATSLLLAAGLATLSGLAAAPALAQRASGETEVQRLIDQLNPTGRTRGIRLPSDGSAPAAPPAPPPAGQERVAAPMGKPAAPARRPAEAADTSPAATLTVLFASGSAVLTPEAARSIDPLGQALTSSTLAPYRFRIEGHTDRVGSRETNQQLSEARAQAVRAYLIQRFGVQPGRLDAVGLGEDQPVVPTPDETPERRNRRVMIVNLGT